MLVDPKKVELTLYSKLERHFLAKMPGEDDAIITVTHKVIYTLNSLLHRNGRPLQFAARGRGAQDYRV